MNNISFGKRYLADLSARLASYLKLAANNPAAHKVLDGQVGILEGYARDYTNHERRTIEIRNRLLDEVAHQSFATTHLSAENIQRLTRQYAEEVAKIADLRTRVNTRLAAIRTICEALEIADLVPEFKPGFGGVAFADTERVFADDLPEYKVDANATERAATLTREGEEYDWTTCGISITGGTTEENEKAAGKIAAALNYATTYGFNERD